jgi:hypothetical protein
MTILKLAIDSSAARQGAQEVVTAVDQVGRSAERAGRAVDTVTKQVTDGLTAQTNRAKDFGRTVEAVGEVTQVTGRIKLLGEEVRNLGSGMGSAASVGTLLAGSLIDVAQISGKVEGGFGGFVNLLKSNPLLLAATVIGGIATAMSLFGDETADANEELKKQIELQNELRKASLDLAIQLQRNADLQRIGFPVDQREQELLRARRLAEVASGLAGQQGFQTFADLTALTGLSQSELTGLAGPGGIRKGFLPSGVPVEGRVTARELREVDVGVTNEAAREIILRVAQIFRNQAVFSPNPAAPVQGIVQAAQPGQLTPGYPSAIGPQVGPGFMTSAELSRYQQGFAPPGAEMIKRDAELATEKLRELEEQLQSLKSLGQDVGSAIGSAFFSIVNGAANARQALAGLLQQFVAIAQQRAIQGIANSIGNTFGASKAQEISNLQSGGVNVPAQPGGGLAGGGIG